MRVTFVGALVIVAMTIVIVLVLGVLLNQRKRGPDRDRTELT